MIHVTLSGDIFLKSRRTQPRMIKRFLKNLDAALAATGTMVALERIGSHRFAFEGGSQETGLADAASRVFGVASVNIVSELAFRSLEELAAGISELTADRVRGHTFAVRVKRRGTHDWRSYDLAARSGALLVEAGGSVHLDDPEESVVVTVLQDRAFVTTAHRRGPGGLPLGVQEPVLALVSGGFDSIVASWMLMSRGCPVEFVHFTLDCAQSDHALAVAHVMSERWAHGTDPQVHLVDFEALKGALYAEVDPRMRQIALKVLMARAADLIAEERKISALVTGDSLGQVSSQTLPHLVAVSTSIERPVLRPLLGLPKESIIDFARMVGTAEISARAREVCDLSEGGPVATSARRGAIRRAVAAIPDVVMSDAVATRKVFSVSDWMPGRV